MEPAPFRVMGNIFNPTDVALSDSLSDEHNTEPAPVFESTCPADYCSRTQLCISFTRAATDQAPGRITASGSATDREFTCTLNRVRDRVLSDECRSDDDQLQRYILSSGQLAAIGASKGVAKAVHAHVEQRLLTEQRKSVSDEVTVQEADRGSSTSLSRIYSESGLTALFHSLQDSLQMYISTSGCALYTRPYSVFLDEFFNASQLSTAQSGTRNMYTYIQERQQENPSVTAAILNDICAYRRAFLDCYRHIHEARFAVVQGTNFEAHFGVEDSNCGQKSSFCMVAGYPGIMEALEQMLNSTLKHSVARARIKDISSGKSSGPRAGAFEFVRQGAFIYIAGDIAAAAEFFLYRVPLNIGLNSVDKALPRIYSARPFSSSYKATHILQDIERGTGRLILSGYMPPFTIRAVKEALYRYAQTLAPGHILTVEMGPATQHTRNFTVPSVLLDDKYTGAGRAGKEGEKKGSAAPSRPAQTKCLLICASGFMDL